MKKKTRSKSRCEEAILFHHPAHSTQQKSFSAQAGHRAHTHPAGSFAQNFFMVSEAYQEPGGCDSVEEMLMQRDYIID